ncbi:lipase family protein [Rhodopila sp.]|jgi:acetyl esterase/lipase|uniref:lipase family protein n=1 Tax=Rhodopila sp. TaxID=2480087 RepID=UPI002CC706A6|nr:lipase family protein [Rhodopila sp.]HVZ07069.1 lipase family protein [Rhodopila sp.]
MRHWLPPVAPVVALVVALLAAWLAVVCAGGARADQPSADGGVSPFYTWTGDVPAQPGTMLRTEPLDPARGLPNAGRQMRILYTSTNGIDGKTPIVVSGMLFLPKGDPPPGGWKLVAWAHGTTGLADICAPSWIGLSARDREYLGTLLAQGWAIVATDYQGLGTAGLHPYLLTRPEANSVLDSIRAVRGDRFGIANQVVVAGQSQGGGAAVATAGFAPEYAPDIDVKGTVATGVPYITRAVLRTPPTGSDPKKPNRTFAYYLYIALTAPLADPHVTAEDLITEKARPALAHAATACIWDMFRIVTADGLNTANGLMPEYGKAFASVLPAMEYTTLALKQPVFIGTGTDDHDVPPALQLLLARQACAAGTVVQAHLYQGLNHSETVNASLADSLPFMRKVFAGDPITPACAPEPQPPAR